MDWKKFLAGFLGNFLGLVAAFLLWYVTQPNLLSQFDASSDRITKDLVGRQVAISHGQVWPFDNGQNLQASIIAKKQMDNYVIVVIDVRATASVEQPKDQKDQKKEALPSKISVDGRLRLTYEKTGNEWYLVSVDGLTAKTHFD